MIAIEQPRHDGDKLKRPHASWVMLRWSSLLMWTHAHTRTETQIQALRISLTISPGFTVRMVSWICTVDLENDCVSSLQEKSKTNWVNGGRCHLYQHPLKCKTSHKTTDNVHLDVLGLLKARSVCNLYVLQRGTSWMMNSVHFRHNCFGTQKSTLKTFKMHLLTFQKSQLVE